VSAAKKISRDRLTHHPGTQKSYLRHLFSLRICISYFLAIISF